MIYEVRDIEGDKTLHEIRNVSEIADAIRPSDDPSVFALDTETTGLKTRQSTLVGLSITTSSHQNFYIGVDHVCPGARNTSLDVVRQALQPFLDNSQQTVVYHNAPFDIVVLRHHDFEMRHQIFDTLSAAHLLDSTRRRVGKSNSLKELSHELLRDIEQPTYSETVGGRTFEEVPVEKAAIYACFDTYCTYRLYEVLRENLETINAAIDPEAPSALEYFDTIEMRNHWNTADMLFNGVKVDVERADEQRETAEELLGWLEREIHQHPLVSRVFDLTSPHQMRKALFGREPRKGRIFTESLADAGVDGTASEDLIVIAKEHEDARPLVQNILRHRKVSGMVTKYLTTFPAKVNPITNRVHPNMRATTISGRYQCSSPNLLGVPKKATVHIGDDEHVLSMRDLVVARDGYWIVAADFSQVDMRSIAHYSEDLTLKDYLDNDYDLHLAALAILMPKKLREYCEGKLEPNEVAGRSKSEDGSGVIRSKSGKTYQISSDRLEELNKARTQMKAVNFGISYGMGADGLMAKLNDVEEIEEIEHIGDKKIWSIGECRDIIDKFFARYQRIPLYKERARIAAQSKGRMVNVFGRPLHLEIFNNLVRDDEITLDCMTRQGEVRLVVRVRQLSQDGLGCLVLSASEINPTVKIDKSGELLEQRELDRWRESHEDCEPDYTFFEVDEVRHDNLRESLNIDDSPSDDELTEYEKQLADLYRMSKLSKREAILSRPTFDGRLAEMYRERGRTPFQSLPFVVIPHSAIQLIQFDNEVGFIRYGNLSTALRQLSSYLISSTSMDLAKIAMIEMRDYIKNTVLGPEPELLFCVHDELVYEVPDEHLREFMLKLVEVMETSPEGFNAKVAAEVEFGPSYERLKEVSTKDDLASTSWTPPPRVDFCQQAVEEK